MAMLIPIVAKAAAFVGANAGTISTVAGIGSTAIGTYGAIKGASDQAAVMKANAAQMEATARDRRIASSIEAERLRRKQRVMLSRDRAGMAQAGALSGTSLDLLDANTVAAELDALTVAYNGASSARGLEGQARLDRAEAGAVKGSGYVSGLGKLAGGLSLANFDPLNYSRPAGAVAP